MSTEIRTPDQRLRVFVSSTPDLAEERAAAFEAVETVQMIPVGAEVSGAAGRRVAEAYLEQSHLFVGVYGTDLGPSAEGGASDVEHHFERAGDIPKLVYIKADGEPEDVLAPLLARVGEDEQARVRRFTGAERLKDAITTDLALVLTERFEESKELGSRPAPHLRDELPAHPTAFVGRDREVAELRRLIEEADVRLITLTGPGGIGKSRLAFEVAAAVEDGFEDGVRYALLSSISDPELVLPTIAKTLGVTESVERSVLDNVKEYLRDRQMLLLLDNFEHVVAAAAQLAELLMTAPGIKVLVTSRALLFLRGEHEFPVPPLEVPGQTTELAVEEVTATPAVRLFVDRAQAMNPSFRVTARNVDAVAQICSQLDGLPLAIELAAARTRLLTPEAMLPRLENRLKLLTGGPVDLPERQQTLRATLDWDYDLLSFEEQTVFRRLSVFTPSALLAAAEEVVPGDGETLDVLDAIESLVNKSLLHQRDTIDGEPRFVMINTLREYTSEKLEEDPAEEMQVRDRHAAFFWSYAEEAARHVMGPDQIDWIDALETEHDNLRSALAWMAQRDDAEAHLAFTAALAPFWEFRAHLSEGQRALEEALARRPDASPPLRAKCLEWAAVLARGQGEYKRSVGFAEKALHLYRALEDDTGLGTAVKLLGGIAYERGDHTTARKYFSESLEIRQRAGDPRGIAELQNNLGVLARLDGDLDAAAANYRAALRYFRAQGDKRAVGRVLMNLGEVSLDQGATEEAERFLRESIELFREIHSHWDIADELELFAGVRLAQRRETEAARMFGTAGALRDLLGAPLPSAEEDVVKGRIQTLRERLGEAAFAAAWNEGRALSADEAVEKILGTE